MGEIPMCCCRAAFLAMCAVSSCPGQLLPSDQSCQTNPQCEINHASSDIFHSIVKTSNFLCRNLFKGNEWLLKVEGGLWIFQSTSLWLEPPPPLDSTTIFLSRSRAGLKNLPLWWSCHTAQYNRGKDRWWVRRIFPDKVYKKEKSENIEKKVSTVQRNWQISSEIVTNWTFYLWRGNGIVARR